jgi:hypothetical protein
MSDGFENYNVLNAGGFRREAPETELSHYALRWLGPDERDAVVFNGQIDRSVVPVAGCRSNLPQGRVFTMTTVGTFKPGVPDTEGVPVAAILVGSDSDDGDVTGGQYVGSPETNRHAIVPFKNEANAPFWSLAPGYIFYTSEFMNGVDADRLEPTRPVTAEFNEDTNGAHNFDTAGLIKPAKVYVDHVIGVVIKGPHPMTGYNPDLYGLLFQGMIIPRLDLETLVELTATKPNTSSPATVADGILGAMTDTALQTRLASVGVTVDQG